MTREGTIESQRTSGLDQTCDAFIVATVLTFYTSPGGYNSLVSRILSSNCPNDTPFSKHDHIHVVVTPLDMEVSPTPRTASRKRAFTASTSPSREQDLTSERPTAAASSPVRMIKKRKMSKRRETAFEGVKDACSGMDVEDEYQLVTGAMEEEVEHVIADSGRMGSSIASVSRQRYLPFPHIGIPTHQFANYRKPSILPQIHRRRVTSSHPLNFPPSKFEHRRTISEVESAPYHR